MGVDTFCPISGLHWFDQTTEFVDSVLEECTNGDMPEEDLELLQSGLTHSDEDVEHSKFYVMICVAGPGKSSDGKVDVFWPRGEAFGDYRRPKKVDKSNTREIFNLLAGNDSGETDEFTSIDMKDENGDGQCFLHNAFETGTAVNYWAYLILRHACPKLLPYILFNMQRDRKLSRTNGWGALSGIDYSPAQGILEQWVSWPSMGKGPDDEDGPWQKILSQDKPVSEILDDAWDGEGGLWATVRPNDFPIAEATEIPPLVVFGKAESHLPIQVSPLVTWPVEVLLEVSKNLSPQEIRPLLAASKALRSLLIPNINHLARLYIQNHQPWLLPAGPVKFDDSRFGREEVTAWEEGWSTAGVVSERMDVEIPWFAYAKACSKSRSMRSRRRIWGIAKQIERLAIENNYL